MANPFDQFDEPTENISQAGNPFDQFDEPEVVRQARPETLFDKLRQRGSNLTAAPSVTPFSPMIRIAGQGVGAAGDILGAGISAAIPDAAKQKAMEYLSRAAQTSVGQGLLKGAEQVGGVYQGFKQKYPGMALDLESAANVASVIPIGKGAQVAKQGAKLAGKQIGKTEPAKVVKDFVRVNLQNNEAVASNLSKEVVKKKMKDMGFRPPDILHGDKFMDDMSEAITLVVRNSDRPLSLSKDPFRDAGLVIAKTKQKLDTQADDLIKSAGPVKLSRQRELDVIDNVLRPDSEYAIVLNENKGVVRKRLETLRENIAKEATPEQLKKVIIDYNKKTSNANKFSEIEQQVYSMLNSAARQDLNEGLEQLGIVGFQNLRNQYGYLKGVEKSFAKAAYAADPMGGLSYLDILSASGIATGLMYQNPAIIGGAFSTLGALHMAKFIQSNERKVRQLFREVEKLTSKANKHKPLSEMLESKYYKSQFEKQKALENLINQRADEAVQEGFSRGL